MSRTVIARRYARALFELAQEKGELDRVEQELNLVVETLERIPELQEWLAAPAVDVERKKALVAERFQELSDWMKNFLFLLLDRGRQGLISRIAEEFKHLADDARGVAEAVVTSALPLTEKEKERLLILRDTEDGFLIAEKDLELRGPGEFFGTMQHGIPDLKIANLYKDVDILKKAQEAAINILKEDKLLKKEENRLLRETLICKFKTKLDELSLN